MGSKPGRKPEKKVDTRKLIERLLVELGPPLVFFAAVMFTGLETATVLFILVTAAAALYSWVRNRRFPVIPSVITAIAVVFGGLTIWLDDATYIEMRPTFVNLAGAAALVYGLMQGRLFLKIALQDGFRMSDRTWRILSWRMAGFLVLLAILNEFMWRSYSTEVWAAYKAATPFLNALFFLANWPLIREKMRGVAPEEENSGGGSSETRSLRRCVVPAE